MRATRWLTLLALLCATRLWAQSGQDPADLLAKGDVAGAQKASQALLDVNPHFSPAHYIQARCLYAQGKPKEMLNYLNKHRDQLTSLTEQQRETLDVETIYALYRIKAHPLAVAGALDFCTTYTQSTSTSLMRGMAVLAGFDVDYKLARDAKADSMPLRLDGSTSGSAQWDNAIEAVRGYLAQQTTLTQLRFDPAAVPPTRLRENRWRASALLEDPQMFEADLTGATTATQLRARFVRSSATFELFPERLGDIMKSIATFDQRFPGSAESLDLKRMASKQVFTRARKLFRDSGAVTGSEAEKLSGSMREEGEAYYVLFRDIVSNGMIGTTSTLSADDRAEVEYQYLLTLGWNKKAELLYQARRFTAEYPVGSPRWGSMRLWEARAMLQEPNPDFTIAAEILDDLLARVNPLNPKDRGTTPWAMQLRAQVAQHFHDSGKIRELLKAAEQLPEDHERKQTNERITEIAKQL